MNRQFGFQNRSLGYLPELSYESNFERWESMGPGMQGDSLEGFIGTEHRDFGDLAAGGELTTIAYGERGELLTFGELIALAGDHFETYEEMRDLATTPAGRAVIAWARWDALNLKNQQVPEPVAGRDVAQDKYYTLATKNFSHYSGGGTGFQTYLSWHSKAIASALQAGEENSQKVWRVAMTKEAFGLHFLTDLFSAGHVRMPRTEIHEWYSQHMPGDQLLRYMAGFLYTLLRRDHQLGLLSRIPVISRIVSGKVKGEIKNRIVRFGGAAIKIVSVGDIVQVALHDKDGEGLQVVSDANAEGKQVPGGFRWTAVGDGRIGKTGANGSTTKMMATAAVITSLRDLERARGVGRKISGSRLSGAQKSEAVKKAIGPLGSAVKAFVPREDPTPGANVPFPGPRSGKSLLEWRWGQLGDTTYAIVDKAVKGRIAGELFDHLSSLNKKEDAHIRRALEAFVKHLRTEGIHALEKAVGRKAR